MDIFCHPALAIHAKWKLCNYFSGAKPFESVVVTLAGQSAVPVEVWIYGHRALSHAALAGTLKARENFFTKHRPSGPSAIAVFEFPRSGSTKTAYRILIFLADVSSASSPCSSFVLRTTRVSASSSGCPYVNSRIAWQACTACCAIVRSSRTTT